MPAINNNLISVGTSAQPASTDPAAMQPTEQVAGESAFNQHLNDELNKSTDGALLGEMPDQDALFEVLSDMQGLQEEDISLQTGNALPLEVAPEALLTAEEELDDALPIQPSSANSNSNSNSIERTSIQTINEDDQSTVVSEEISSVLTEVVSEDNTANSVYQASLQDLLSNNQQPAKFVNAAIMSPDRLKVEMSSVKHVANSKNIDASVLTADAPESAMDELTQVSNFDELDQPEFSQPKQNVTNTILAQAGNKAEIVTADLTKTVQTVSAPLSNTLASDLSKAPAESLSTQHEVFTPVGKKQWGAEFSQRVSLMVNNAQQQQVAELRLNPAHLGPVSVRLQLDDDKASISFVTHQPAVKEAIESSLPKLREQLEQQGLELAHADVSHQEQNDSSADSASDQSAQGYSGGLSGQEEVAPELIVNLEVSDGVSIFV